MIEPLDRSGHSPKALVRCDDCGLTQYETCDYERRPDGGWQPNEGQILHRLTKRGWTFVKGRLRCMACEMQRKFKPMEEAMTTKDARKLTETEAKFLALADGTRTLQEITARMGWSSTGAARNYLRKLAPHGARARAAGGTVVHMKPSDPTLREPTKEQNRQILEMLAVSYDAEKGRYRDCESDVTVAEAIGGGVLFGWVARLREEFFGPDGANEELDSLRADVAEWIAKAADAEHRVNEGLREFTAAKDKVMDIQRRLEALVKAAGPRARA